MKFKTKLIAEIGSNHNRDIIRCYKLIDEAKNLGFYAVKFQLFKINALFSKDAKKTYKNVIKKRKRELPINFLPKLYKYCKKKKIKFSCTPFDLKSVEVLKNYVDFYKIASYELNWKELLEACAKTKKPVILSTGMATYEEVKKAYKILKKYNNKISLLHCVSAYPASPVSCNLKSIDFLRKKFGCPVGWSDHTVNPLIIYNVIKFQKADIIELHFDLEGHGWEEKEGNHHCWLPKDLQKMISYINNENSVMGSFKKKYSLAEKNERKFRADPLDGLRPLKKFRKFL
tara:strand:+ start:1115 stop:1975 length:861 start_codon:yes stop_codon:yes gene_type:complete